MGVGTLQSLPIVFIQLASFLESPLLSPLLLTETPFPPLLPLYCFPSQSPVCPPQDASKSHQAMVGQVMSYGLFPTSPTRAEEPSQSLRCVAADDGPSPTATTGTAKHTRVHTQP